MPTDLSTCNKQYILWMYSRDKIESFTFKINILKQYFL